MIARHLHLSPINDARTITNAELNRELRKFELGVSPLECFSSPLNQVQWNSRRDVGAERNTKDFAHGKYQLALTNRRRSKATATVLCSHHMKSVARPQAVQESLVEEVRGRFMRSVLLVGSHQAKLAAQNCRAGDARVRGHAYVADIEKGPPSDKSSLT